MPIAVSDNATVTLAFHDWRRLEQQIASLEERLKTATVAPPVPESDVVAELRAMLNAALPIVQWAAGQLNPESHPGWPHEQLHALGELLIAGTTDDDADRVTLGITFREMAAEAADIEDVRKTRREAAQELLSIPDGNAQLSEET
jgi:hypothetical protein